VYGDTIAAISTPLGEGGIGIVRISGPEAVEIAKKMFRSKRGGWEKAGSRSLIYGHVFDREGEVVDEVLLGYMKAPRTFTGEDVVEFNCHGGIVPLRRTLEIALENGARLAQPGEFSKRAFLNGRIDLAQAESIVDIVRAKTDEALKLAVAQLKGKLSGKIKEMQDNLLGLLAQVEANIDFPEDDLEEAAGVKIISTCEELIREAVNLIRAADAGKIYREGIRTAIIGKPNVGKSSLLNAMLRENRAIVTEVPGTTRDVIEEIVNIRGIPLKIIDTAGLRETEDIVEKIGVEKTMQVVEQADLVLLVLDAGRGLDGEDLSIMNLIGDKKTILLINKVDVEEKKIEEEKVKKLMPECPVLWISATAGKGLNALEEKIAAMVLGGHVSATDAVVVSNARHKQALVKAAGHLSEAVEGTKRGMPVDIVAVDLRAAWEALGEITGSTVTEDLLDRIFEDFCIGK